MQGIIVAVIFSSLAPGVLPSGHRPRVMLAIIEPAGHRANFRSVAARAPYGLRIAYHYECKGHAESMTVVIARSTVDYGFIGKREVLARFQTDKAPRGDGVYTYARHSWYRLNVTVPSECSWSMRLFA